MGLRILLIEEQGKIAAFIVRGLREEDLTVERTDDGAAGWHCLTTQAWDVVLLNRWLPEQEGLAILQRFRQAGQQTPVFFLTARDAISDGVRDLDGGADDYLCKPFALQELLVRALVRRPAQSAGTSFACADVRLDRTRQQVERHGHRLDLTGWEYALLLFFLRRPGEILRRTRIYENVWEERYGGLSNTLEAHMMEPRHKLEAHGPRLTRISHNPCLEVVAERSELPRQLF